MSEAVFQQRIFGNFQPQQPRRNVSIDGVTRARTGSITGIQAQYSKHSVTATPVTMMADVGISSTPRVRHMPVQANPIQQVESRLQNIVVGNEATGDGESAVSRVHKLKTAGIIALIALTFMGGIAIFAMTIYTNHKAVAQVAAVTKEANSAAVVASADKEPEPEETPVSNAVMGTYKVAADEPRYIRIPKLKTMARVMQVDILKNGQLGTPRNTNDAAWYKGSSRLSDAGAVLIDGHVSGATTAGVFYGLKNLGAGDVVSVEGGDGQIYNYKVVKKEQMTADKVNMSNLLVPVTAGKAGLNLITCGGKYDSTSGTFNERMIIYTERV